ncbi:hypothetical protein BDV11DRAFT_38823 [Aspergillus similis]
MAQVSMFEEPPSKQAMATACSAGLADKPGIDTAAAVAAARSAGMAREVDPDEVGEAARQEEGNLDWSMVETCFGMVKERKRTGKEKRWDDESVNGTDEGQQRVRRARRTNTRKNKKTGRSEITTPDKERSKKKWKKEGRAAYRSTRISLILLRRLLLLLLLLWCLLRLLKT